MPSSPRTKKRQLQDRRAKQTESEKAKRRREDKATRKQGAVTNLVLIFDALIDCMEVQQMYEKADAVRSFKEIVMSHNIETVRETFPHQINRPALVTHTLCQVGRR